MACPADSRVTTQVPDSRPAPLKSPLAGPGRYPDQSGPDQSGPARTGRIDKDGETVTSTQQTGGGQLDLGEATRQLEMAAHDARVAASCIGLGDLDGAHTHALLARTAADGAQNLLQAALASGVTVAQ